MINILAIIPTPSTSSNTEETIFTDITYPTDDSWIELTQPHCNHGTEREIHIKTSCDTIRRAYLKFDVSVIPTDKGIISTKLYLYCVYANPKSNIQIDIHKTEDNWNERTITWDNAPPTGTFIASNTTVNKKNNVYTWDITPYAQSEHNSDKTLSVVAKFPTDDPAHQDSNSQYQRLFASKETPPKHKRPYLEIMYTCVRPPIANFTYSPIDPVTYETVTFNASASYDPNGHIIMYAWNFGDENTTTTTDPIITHVYTDTGNFTVTLTVTDNDGFTNSTTAIVTVSNPAILRVSLPTGKTVGPNPDPWQNEGWLLNLTEPSLTFRVRVNSTSHTHTLYDIHLVIALDDTAYNNLANLTVDTITIPKTDFQYGTPKPYNIWTWPDDVYPAWFDDTYVNLGTIPPNGYKEAIVSATFSGLATIRIHLDAYGKMISDTPTRAGHIAWSPHSKDSTVLFQPKPPPISVSITPTSVVMDVSQSVTFDSSVSGGTPPYTYQWYLDDVPVSSTTASTWTFFPTSPGTYEVYLIVADSSDPAESNHVIVTVNPPLAVSTSPPSVVMDVGQSQTFTSSLSGGTPPYTYQWYLNGNPVGTALYWIFTPTSPGSYQVYLTVTDYVGVTAQSNLTPVTVNLAFSVSIFPMSVTMNVGESQLFTSSVSGGAPPYIYQWYLNGIAVIGGTSSSWAFTPPTTGYYKVYLRVTDDVDMSVESDSASVTVRGHPKAAFTYSPLYPCVNETATFNAYASAPNGGVISEYTWYFGDGDLIAVTDPLITHVYAAEGIYTATLVVTDSEGLSNSTSQIITVYAPLLYSTDYTTHSLGEEFLINVVVVGIINLYSFKLKLGYNTTLLDAINITEGPFLKSFGSTSATMEIHDPGGYVLMNVALSAPTLPAEGSGILATIKFKVTHATVYPEIIGCSLDLYDTDLGDPASEPILHIVYDGSYEFVPFPAPPIGPAIDVYTQKLAPYSGKGPNMPSDAFGPQEEVILYAYVSYDCEPAQDKLVVFEVKNPGDEPVIFRTATSNAEGIATSSFRIPWEAEGAESLFGEWIIYGSVEIHETRVNDTCAFKFGWLIEITQVKTTDTYGNLESSFTKGDHIHFNITVKNIAFTSKIATFTLVVYDECDVPIGHVVLHDWLISPGTTEIFMADLQIPKWAYVGIGTAYANAYTDLPQTCGTPYCPEISTTFTITKP